MFEREHEMNKSFIFRAVTDWVVKGQQGAVKSRQMILILKYILGTSCKYMQICFLGFPNTEKQITLLPSDRQLDNKRVVFGYSTGL